MKIKCNICKKETDVKIDKMEIIQYINHLVEKDEIMILVKYQTFCQHCGEYVFGVKRKILTYEKILKLLEDKNY